MARKPLIVAILAVVLLELGVLGWGFYEQQNCLSQPEGYIRWGCYEPYFRKLTIESSAASAMAEASKLREQGVFSSCHIFGHVIGSASLEKHDFDVGKAFSSCTRGCIDGCFHGVLERYVRNEADPSNAMSQIVAMCDSVGTDSIRKRQCIHGVGHGLRAHGYLSVPEAVDACNTFSSEPEEADYWVNACIGGMVMEHINQYLIQDLKEEQFREAIPKMCEQIEPLGPQWTSECIRSVALGFMYYTGYDLERSKELCEELPKEQVVPCKSRVLSAVQHEKIDVFKSQEFFFQ